MLTWVPSPASNNLPVTPRLRQSSHPDNSPITSPHPGGPHNRTHGASDNTPTHDRADDDSSPDHNSTRNGNPDDIIAGGSNGGAKCRSDRSSGCCAYGLPYRGADGDSGDSDANGSSDGAGDHGSPYRSPHD